MFCLYMFCIEFYIENGECWVRFWVYLVQNNLYQVVECDVKVLDECDVLDFGGYWELWLVIEIILVVGDQSWFIEMILINWDFMWFWMLLGCIVMFGCLEIYLEVFYFVGELVIWIDYKD